MSINVDDFDDDFDELDGYIEKQRHVFDEDDDFEPPWFPRPQNHAVDDFDDDFDKEDLR